MWVDGRPDTGPAEGTGNAYYGLPYVGLGDVRIVGATGRSP